MVAIKVKRRVEKLLLRKGKMPGEGADPEQQEQTLWDKLCAASLQGRIALGPKAGWRVRRMGDHPVLLPPGERYLCADADGFNVHAHTSVGAAHKAERERLCRYILRPALCGQGLSLLPSGDVIFTLKRTWSDGTKYLVFTPMELIEKLAVLVPPPHKHLVTYHGILSSAAKWRKEIVPGGQAPGTEAEPKEPPDGAEPELEPMRPRRLLWAQLLQRTFGLVRCTEMPQVRWEDEDGSGDSGSSGDRPAVREPVTAPPVVPSRHQVQTQWDFTDQAADFADPPGDLADLAAQWADPPADFAADYADQPADFAFADQPADFAFADQPADYADPP